MGEIELIVSIAEENRVRERARSKLVGGKRNNERGVCMRWCEIIKGRGHMITGVQGGGNFVHDLNKPVEPTLTKKAPTCIKPVASDPFVRLAPFRRVPLVSAACRSKYFYLWNSV